MQVEGYIQNPQLEGKSFEWAGGQTGVLLVHGFTATTSEVRPLAKALHQQGFTVSAPLLPGHGSQPAEMNRMRWQDWASAVEAAYVNLTRRCDQVVIAGESMGGLLSLYLASQHPEIAAVLTYAPAVVTGGASQVIIANLVAPFVPIMRKPQGPPTPADELWQGYTVYPVRALTQLYRLQSAVRRSLPLIRRPLLVVAGRLDTSVLPVTVDILSKEVRSTVKQIHWMEHSGHCVLLDVEFDQIVAITTQFLHQVLN